MNTTLPRQAAELASDVGDTMTEVISKGKDRALELVSVAEEILPDSAMGWTREHVPGLTPRQRRGRLPILLVLFVAAGAVAAVIWYRRRPASEQPADHLAAARDREPAVSAIAGN